MLVKLRFITYYFWKVEQNKLTNQEADQLKYLWGKKHGSHHQYLRNKQIITMNIEMFIPRQCNRMKYT